VEFNPNEGVFNGSNLRAVAHGRTIAQMLDITQGAWAGRSGSTFPPPAIAAPGHPNSTYGWGFYNWSTTGWGGGLTIMQRATWINRGLLGWNDYPAPIGNIGLFNQNTVITSSRTVYAQWQVTLTFNSNQYGIIASTVTRTVVLNFSANTHHFHPNTGASPIIFPFPADGSAFGAVLRLYEIERPASFLGWHTRADGDDTLGHWVSENTILTTYLNGEPFIGGNTVLFAQWGGTITFMPNGAPPESGIPASGIFREAGVGLTMGVAQAPGNPAIFGLPDQFHVPGVPTANWNPYWGAARGITFGGWNRLPDRSGPIVTQTTSAEQPIAIFAIWLVDVIYHPTGGQMQADGPPQTTYHREATPLYSLFGAARQPTNLTRPGWTFVNWNEERWGHFNDEPSLSLLATIDRTYEIFAQWQARLTFDLQGGFVDFNPANVIRDIGEGPGTLPTNTTTLNNWVAAIPSPNPRLGMPVDPMRPGFDFGGWYTRGNFVNGEWERIPFDGATVVNGHTTVFAHWVPIILDEFAFIKTTNDLYESPPYIEPLNGAVFRLYREVNNAWVFVTERTSSTTANGQGWVVFDDVITYPNRYRLVESVAPRGYEPPPGHWILEWDRVDPWDHTTWVIITPQAHGGNPLFLPFHNDVVDDDVLHVGNRTVYVNFSFIKTDHYLRPITDYVIQPLPGAVFSFYLYTPRSNSGLHSAMVTPEGIAANYWTRVYQITSSNPEGHVTAPLWQGGNVFHMLEVAPPGFDDPPGQWRINLNVDPNGDVYIVQPIVSLGGNPEFRLISVEVAVNEFEDILHVYNLPETRPFEFIKVDDVFLMDPGNPDFDPDIHALDGAVFRLYRELSLNPGNWEYVGSYTSGNSGTKGLVRFDIWMIGRYRLIEYTAPDGHVLQTGHWIIDWDRSADPQDPDTWVITTTYHGGNQAFEIRLVPDDDGDPQDVRFLGNERKASFRVHKTDYRLYEEINAGIPNWVTIDTFLLPGAEFVLLRYNNLVSGNTPPEVLVTTDMIGNDEGEWSVVWEGASTAVWDSTGSVVVGLPMNMLLDTRFTYFQLLEIAPPSGFQMPPGQWRIELAANTSNPGGWHLLHAPFRTHWVRVINIGVGMHNPEFHRNPNGVWYVGNFIVMQLPLMGGAGRTAFMVSGMTITTIGVGLMVYFVMKKNGVDLLKRPLPSLQRYIRRR